ncbi:hypothetical protein SAMN05428981_1011361 [Bacillus sp. OV194]|nr:hypothetical protein SAMN05428981_1011361 [Bacillus sp. OV194]
MLPVLSLLTILSMTLVQNLKKERSLPDPHWSRSVSLPLVTSEKQIAFTEVKNGKYQLYLVGIRETKHE